MTFAFFSILATLAPREQLAQTAVSRTIARVNKNVRRAVHEDEARADQKLRLVVEFGIIEFAVSPHHAGQRVVVGNADRGKTQVARVMHIGTRVRTAAQEREIRGDADFGIARRWRNAAGTSHANNPCTNQLAGAGWPSSVTSSLP